tara:strand:+ start:96 stop:305 length:210 start_codon:yes stop_codon:yes gene_type:complete
MKITKQKLVKIIKEVVEANESVGVTTHSLVGTLRRAGLAADRSMSADDEIYIMTGDAEGVTIKVLRRGR